jgi:LacI family transcriptional regulator
MGRLAADYVMASPLQRKYLKERELPIRLVVRESSGAAPKSEAEWALFRRDRDSQI